MLLAVLAESHPRDGAIDQFGDAINKAIADTFNKENWELAKEKAAGIIKFARENLDDDQIDLREQIGLRQKNSGNNKFPTVVLPVFFLFTIFNF
jgi:hypothetical protein